MPRARPDFSPKSSTYCYSTYFSSITDPHTFSSMGFSVLLKDLDMWTGEVSEGQQEVTYQLRVTLFDRRHQQFFGKTWKSLAQRMKNNKITFNEVLYFHTLLRVSSTLAVVELVALSLRPDGSQHALGRGFSVLELFSDRPEAPAADGDRRLNLHHGSPRSLLHPLLKDTTDCKHPGSI
uniref:Nephronophthisis 4 n=1 Tax=Sphaeramia orbicularis TaxID=375764 RepID=A0A672YCD9_9TELE